MTPLVQPLTTKPEAQRFFDILVGFETNFVKGQVYLLPVNNAVAFSADNYTTGQMAKFIYGCQRVSVTAEVADTRLEAVNFYEGDIVYWDSAWQRFTNDGAGLYKYKCARCIKEALYSGGVPAGATLILEFTPDA